MANQLVPSSSFSTTPWEYDVFLSFRGKDTRYNFTNHLHHALVRLGIRTFLDENELPTGEEISPTLLKAIENSRISVIVFSENYASSRWCLDELVHILECRKSKGQMTRPIFYKVDPSDVRHQKNSYGVAFAVPSRKYENDPEKVQRWRTALTKAANLKGDTLNEKEYETTFIDRIVEEISIQVSNRTCLNVARYPVGIESCAKEVEVLLDVGGNDRRVVGIWGTTGIGKTTIAKAVYNAIAHKFKGSCFLADVRETLTSHEGLIQLQKTFLSKILGGAELKFVNDHEGISLIKNRLRQKKILLILDDVDKLERLEDWVNVDCFGEGSRVIITTEDRRLLKFYGSQWIYEVQKLGYDEALELFSWNAFKRNRPPNDYLSLAQRVIFHAEGLPLTLNRIGSYLRNESIDRWQAVLNSYYSYSREPYIDIQMILRKTYDALDYNLRQVFLDIACFFKGEDKDYVLDILRNSKLNVCEDRIEVLVEKAIITIEHNRILINDLLERMGKHIVYEESPDEPGKRSRLWHHEDVRNVLMDCGGTKKIRGIVVNLPKPDEIPLNPASFLKMGNLKFFINRNAHFSGHVDYLPNSLRLIEFGGGFNIDKKHMFVLNLPSYFHPRNLVSFGVDRRNIQLKRFKVDDSVGFIGLCDLPMRLDCWSALTYLNLARNNSVSLPDCISKAINLKQLCLRDCKRLREILVLPPKLEGLHLQECTSLEKIPKLPPSLEFLNLCNCLGLSGDEVAKLENNLLNEEIDPRSRFRLNIIYPGNEIPKWFSYTSNYPTTSQHLPEYEDDESHREFRFEIPLKLQVGETLLGLALSFVYEPPTCNKWRKVPIRCIIIDGERRFEHYLEYSAYIKATHVSLALKALRGLEEQEQHGDICQVVFRFHNGCPVKSCGVHFLLRNQDGGSSSSEDGDGGSSPSGDEDEEQEQEQEQEQPSDSDVPFDIEEDEEQLHLPLRPPSSLGKRPRPRGSSDIVDDAYDQQQQWLSSSSEPADDHPKRRKVDPNVPIDIEEQE